jgi:hypothetical protein
MKDSSVLALIFVTYIVLAVVFFIVTSIKIDRPFLIPTATVLAIATTTITFAIEQLEIYVSNRDASMMIL